MDITEAAATGNRKATLIALRDVLARTIQNCDSGRDMAALSKRLIEVMNEIEAIEVNDEDEDEFNDVLDEL